MNQQSDQDIEVLWGECKQCKHELEIFIGKNHKGDHLMKAVSTRAPGKILWDEDPMLDEILGLVDDLLSEKNAVDIEYADLVAWIFSFLIRFDPDGSSQVLSDRAKCPNCESDDIKWLETGLPENIGIEAPSIPRKKWESLNRDEKYKWVSALLDEALLKLVDSEVHEK